MKIYQGKHLEKPEILKHETYKGYEYYIITLGTHPCSYILLPEGHRYHGKNYEEIPLKCHFGLTYSEATLLRENVITGGEWVIGWDYAHVDDHYDLDLWEGIPGHKWSLEELVVEMEMVIDQLVKEEEMNGED